MDTVLWLVYNNQWRTEGKVRGIGAHGATFKGAKSAPEQVKWRRYVEGGFFSRSLLSEENPNMNLFIGTRIRALL